MAHKLDAGQKHLMVLLDRDKKLDGWTPVSPVVYPFVANLPQDFRELQVLDDQTCRGRLTATGQQILMAMEWL